METSSKTGALLSPDVSSASALSRSEQKTVSKPTLEETDIDAKTFEEAEANIKALVEEAEPKPISKVKKEAPLESSAELNNSVIETDDSFAEFVFLSSNNEDDADVTEDNNDLADDEVDPESVLDKIFDAATSGNSADFNRLLFSKTNKKQADSKEIQESNSEGKLEETTFKPLVDQLLYKNKVSSRKRKAENNNIAIQKKNKGRNNSVDFKDIKNTTSLPEPKVSLQSDIEESSKPDVPKLSLIDYSVLTNALTKTLQENLNGGENDVKIVIFCNNKPIQSFSLKNNLGEVAAATTYIGPQTKDSSDTNSQKFAEELCTNKSTKVSNGAAVISESSSHKLSTETKGSKVHDRNVSDHKLNSQSGIQRPRGETNGQIITVNSSAPNVVKKVIISNLTTEPTPEQTTKATDSEVQKTPQVKLKTGFNLLSKNKTKNTSTFLRIRGKNVNTLLTGSGQKQSETTENTEQEQDNSDDKKSDSDDDSNRLVINTEEPQTQDSQTASPAESVVDSSRPSPKFKCEFCDKGFSLRRTLNRHKLRYHAGPYPLQGNTSKHNNSVPNSPSVSTSNTVPADLNGIGVADANGHDTHVLIVNTTETKPETEQKESIDILKVKTESSVEEIDISKLDAEAVKNNENLNDLSYIQSILTKGPLYDIIHSKNTAQSTKVNTLKSVIQSVEKSKRLELPIDSNGDIQPVFVCEHCGKYYRARKTLKDHFLREHAKELGEEPLYLYIAGNKYQCTICFHNFHSASELLTHTKTHTGELRSPCNICGKVYASVHVLRRHIDNVHSEVRPRPFRCQLCDYAASNKWHLKEHHRRHTGEQPFCCPVCNKSFSHQGTMNRHCKTIHRFDSSSLSREQLRLQQGLSNITVPSLDLARTELSLADLAAPEHTADQTSDDSNSGVDIDMSIVKTEPEEENLPSVDTAEIGEIQLNGGEVGTSVVKMEPVESM